ncbi:hypothetical protein [Moraxella bovis]|nr:hypothetical protein [Moraxella bovis]
MRSSPRVIHMNAHAPTDTQKSSEPPNARRLLASVCWGVFGRDCG